MFYIETPISFACEAVALEQESLVLHKFSASKIVQTNGNMFSIDFEKLRAGDVVLFRSQHTADVISNLLIEKYQGVFTVPSAAFWTHVGILDADLCVWDAVPNKNVRTRVLRDILSEKSMISFWRPAFEIDVNKLTSSILAFSNMPYSIFNISTGGRLLARLARAGYSGYQLLATNDESVICSLYVHQVLKRSSGKNLFPNLPIVTPSDFASISEFRLIELRWQKCKFETAD
jgi:hypothetical protein